MALVRKPSAAELRDPGRRSKLSDAQLKAASPELYALRQRTNYAKAPAAPGSGFTNAQLAGLLSMQSRDEFGPQELELQQQGQQLDRRVSTQIPAFFQAYRDQIAAAQARQAAAVPQQVASLQNMATQAAGDTGQLAGQPLDSQAAARATAAAGVRSAAIQNQAGLAQQLGGIQNSYLGNLGLNSYGQQQGAVQHVQDQQSDLAGKRALLASLKGDFQVTQRQKLLADDQNQSLAAALRDSQVRQNLASAGAATSNAQTNATNAQTRAAHAGDANARWNGALNTYRITNGAWREWGKTPAGKVKRQAAIDAYNKNGGATGDGKDQFGNTPKQRTAAQDSFDRALLLAGQYKGSIKTEAELVQFLTGAKGINVAMARAAAQSVFHDGALGPNTTKTLKNRGVTRLPKVKVQPVAVAPTAPVSPFPSLTDQLLNGR